VVSSVAINCRTPNVSIVVITTAKSINGLLAYWCTPEEKLLKTKKPRNKSEP